MRGSSHSMRRGELKTEFEETSVGNGKVEKGKSEKEVG